MKILSINKFYYLRGGSETYFFSLNSMLAEKGHEIIPFSMKDSRNVSTPYEEYFIDNINYNKADFLKNLRNAFSAIYSFNAKTKIKRLLNDTKPDLAHFHLFQHQLSPSILKAVHDFGLPIVNTVHDLKPLCPNYKMLNKGAICEKCKRHKYFHCVSNKCIKGSFSGSMTACLEAYLNWIIGSYKNIDAFIAPSNFLRNKFIEYGYSPEKLFYIPNYVKSELFEPCYSSGNYFIFFGRLIEEKGIETLIKAMRQVKGTDLYIIGDGPLKDSLNTLINNYGLTNVKIIGHQTGRALKDLIENCKFSIMPSEWYENSPFAVLESMACGKPVIASDIGGLPEIVDNNRTGLLFSPCNHDELAEKINSLIDDSHRLISMGKEGREDVNRKFNEKLHYEKINQLYEKLLKNNSIILSERRKLRL